MGGVREDIEAPGIVDELVAREKDITLFGDKTDQQEDHKGGAQPERRKQDKPVQERIEHPNTCYLLTGSVEGGGGTQTDGVEQHPVEVPAYQSKGDIDRKFSLVAVDPGTAQLDQFVLQLFQINGWAEHRQHLLPL